MGHSLSFQRCSCIMVSLNDFEILRQITSSKGQVYLTADIVRRHKFGYMGGDISFLLRKSICPMPVLTGFLLTGLVLLDRRQFLMQNSFDGLSGISVCLWSHGQHPLYLEDTGAHLITDHSVISVCPFLSGLWLAHVLPASSRKFRAVLTPFPWLPSVDPTGFNCRGDFLHEAYSVPPSLE